MRPPSSDWLLAVFQYLDKGDGIAYSPGALLVLVATALILGASIVMLARSGFRPGSPPCSPP